MIGYVKFFDKARHFGFICFEDVDGQMKEHFFSGDVQVQGQVLQYADAVEFDLGSHNGKSCATNVRLAADLARINGWVFSFNREKFFGFVAQDGPFPNLFFHQRDCEYDVLGRRCISEPATPVSFSVVTTLNGRQRAVRVRNESPALNEIDISTYREQGKVVQYDPIGGTGHISRPSADRLFFDRQSVLSEGADEIRIGTVLDYAVTKGTPRFEAASRSFHDGWAATDIFVCFDQPVSTVEPEPVYFSPGSIEDRFLHASELPADEPAPMPVIRKPGEVYTPLEKKTSLRELIAKKSAA